MGRSCRRITALASTFLLATAAGAEAVWVARKIPYDPASGVREKVKTECQIDTRLPLALVSRSKDAELVDSIEGSRGRRLELRITQVLAPGGGPFSGPKIIEVTGILRKGKLTLGSFRAKRYSTGGAFGAFKGTCGVLTRVTEALASDISGFLKAPSMNAELGDAR